MDWTMTSGEIAHAVSPGVFFWPWGIEAMKNLRGMLRCSTTFCALMLGGTAWAQEALAPAVEAPVEAVEPPPPPAPPPTISDQIAAGKLILEVRARYETVDQTRTATLKDEASAFTVRTRFGWETAEFAKVKGLIEFEDVRQAGPEHYAVNVPGVTTAPLNGADKARYPVVNDPDVTELNRLQLTWTPSAALQLTAGRQRILLDDQRFVGNVGWRQDEQTMDGFRADLALGRFKATYAYVTHINRILGELKDWDSDSHLLNATWSPAEALRLQGFVYALDFGNSAVNSSLTKGVKASGKTGSACSSWPITPPTPSSRTITAIRPISTWPIGAATSRRPSTSTPSRLATSRWKATGRAASPRPWPRSTPSRAGATPSSRRAATRAWRRRYHGRRRQGRSPRARSPPVRDRRSPRPAGLHRADRRRAADHRQGAGLVRQVRHARRRGAQAGLLGRHARQPGAGLQGGGIDGAHILTPMPYLITTGAVTGQQRAGADVHPGPPQPGTARASRSATTYKAVKVGLNSEGAEGQAQMKAGKPAKVPP
jgi:hypothetical protein